MSNFRKKVELFFKRTLDEIYPERHGIDPIPNTRLSEIRGELVKILAIDLVKKEVDLEMVSNGFMHSIAGIKSLLDQDVEALYEGDPAAKSKLEIIITYPGFYAVAAYRIARVLYLLEVPLIPRIITEHAKSYTGIEIHPGADIGKHLCIDHGTGVVIGETAVIGDNVKIYQGVTLGALSIPKRKSKEKRHPTIEDNVVIYAQAIILGGKTVIGKNSVIGGNVWITESVPANTRVLYEGSSQNYQIIRK